MQTDFSTSVNSAEGLVGSLYDTSINQIDSFVAGENIGFGEPVYYDSASKTIKRILKDSKNSSKTLQKQ